MNFQVCCTAKKELFCRSLEDKWSFLVPRKKDEGPLNGPLDFVWSQRIKSFPSTFVSHYNFRSPIVMMQQDELFAGLVPALEKVTAQFLEETPLGMDLDVTRESYPWMSYGMIDFLFLYFAFEPPGTEAGIPQRSALPVETIWGKRSKPCGKFE